MPRAATPASSSCSASTSSCSGPIGLTIWAVQMAWIPFLAAGVINGACHHTGYRNFRDAGRFHQPRAVGGPHRRRGASQQPPHLSELRQVLRQMVGARRRLGMDQAVLVARARPHQAPSAEVLRIEGKHEIDLDTIRAVISDRSRVMARYRRMVVEPIARMERERVEPKARDVPRPGEVPALADRCARQRRRARASPPAPSLQRHASHHLREADRAPEAVGEPDRERRGAGGRSA